MVSLDKPKSITITISNRKEKQSKSFVVYDASVDEVERKIKKALSQ